MTAKQFSLRAVSSAVALLGLIAVGQAHAGLSSASAGVPISSKAGTEAITTINVAGITSIGEVDTGLNTVMTFNVGANTLVTGIGWNVNVTAFTPSWLSEMTVSFEDSARARGVFLNVSNTNSAGTESQSSNGIIALSGPGLEFNVGPDGILRVEFFEGFDDATVSPDGIWNFGSLTVQTVAVPEPATYGLMALGLFGIGAMVRRRRV